ncbi:MAG: hypothetical protein KKB20_29425 [Proteobacteria bacterium]|nr:hypothetical protein [Pseudomonadota bacterium]
MKIQPNLTVIQGQKSGSVRRAERRSPTASFETVLSRADSPDTTLDLVQVVSIENQKASRQPPPLDLGQAEEVLQSIKGELGRISKTELRSVHRLDGLVHVFPA